MSDSVRPHRQQPTRLPRPWDSPGKNTGVGCHFLLQCRKVKSQRKSLSRVQLLVTSWTAAYQAPPSMGFSRQAYWSGVPLPFISTREVTQSCPTLCDPMDCSPPGSSVRGIFQARVLEWVAHFLLQAIFPTQESNPGLLHRRQMLYHLSQSTRQSQKKRDPTKVNLWMPTN